MKETFEFLRKRLVQAAPLAMVLALAVTAAVSGASTNDAAVAWQTLTNLSLPSPPAEWEANPPTAGQLATFQQEEATGMNAAADQAQKFYRQFPKDANATQARLLELNMLEMAVHQGVTNHLADLADREQALLKIPDLSQDERYMLNIDIINHQLNLAGTNHDALLETAGRKLLRDFPGYPEGYAILFNVANVSHPPKARELLNLILTTNAPDEIQVPAQSLLKQLDLVGTSPDIQFMATDGRRVDLRALTGKVVLVDFWASWCPPCVALFPELKSVYDQWHPQGFEIIGINLDDKKPLFARFVADKKVSWPEYFDGQGWQNSFARQFGVSALPAMLLVDKKGRVRDINGGKDLAAAVAKLLAE